ncbi:hypothetical protein LguiA_007741 [Lonicera macranthoides]
MKSQYFRIAENRHQSNVNGKVQSQFFYGIPRVNGRYHPRSTELKVRGVGIRSSDQTKEFLSIRLVFKDFRFQVAEDGKSVSITEITRGGSYRINIDFKVADWVSRELKKAKYCNDRGIFISLMELRRGTVCRVIVFPACKNGEGWVKAVDALREVVNGRVYFQTIREETGAIRERRYMPNDQMKSQIHSQSENQIGWGKVNLESKGKCEEQGREQMVVVSEKDGGHLIAIAAFEELDSRASSGKGKELLCLEETEGADRDNIVAGPSQLVSSRIGTAVGEGNIRVEEKVKQGMVEGNKENEHVGINNFV